MKLTATDSFDHLLAETGVRATVWIAPADCKVMAETVGRSVIVAPWLALLPRHEQEAVVLHELGHISGRHLLWRLLLLWCPPLLFLVCQWQERLADRFAARHRRGLAMLAVLARLKRSQRWTLTHGSIASRIRALHKELAR